MPNMSYCRFENTAKALQDCVEVLLGEDEYTQSVKDLSNYELSGYNDLKEFCQNFLDAVDEFEDREPAEDEDEDEE